MKITKIEVQKKDKTRANLYLDENFYCGVSIELIIKEHLKVGMEIEADKLDDVILEDEKEKASTKVMKYIGTSLKTIKQIRDYLKKKEYNNNTIDYVIDKLIEYKYIDDEAYSKAFLLTYSHKYGKLKIRENLRSKGVSDDIIDSVLEKSEVQSNIEGVANKYLKNKELSFENFNKLSRFLYSRGYTFDEINSVINKLKEK